MSTPHCIKAAAYYRMSDHKQEDSIDRQKSQVEPFAVQEGYTIVRVYVDEGISGSEEGKRKGFQQMLRDAQAGHFQAILVDEDDRFCRFDSIDYGYYVKPLRDKGVILVTVAKGVVDWNSFSGRITSAVQVEGKNQEQESIARRVLSGMLQHAAEGKPQGGRVVYGYRVRYQAGVDAKGRHKLFPVCYEPDPRTAPVVQLIFKLAAEGQSLGTISRELYRRGVASPGGKAVWGRNVLLSVLKRRKYLGDFTWGERPCGKRMRYDPLTQAIIRPRRPGERRGRKNPLDQCTLKTDAHEALVSREVFQQVQASLAGNRGRSTPLKEGGGFVLSKLLVCGDCGAHLRGLTKPNGVRVFICGGYLDYGKQHCSNNSIHEAALVEVLLRKLQGEWISPDRLQALRDEALRRETELRSGQELPKQRQELARLEAQIVTATRKLFEVVEADNLAEGNAYLRDLKARRDQLRKALEQAEASQPVQEMEDLINAAEDALWRLQEALRAEDRPLLRQVLRSTFTKVVVHFEHYDTACHRRSRFLFGEAFIADQDQPRYLFTSDSRSEQVLRFVAADMQKTR